MSNILNSLSLAQLQRAVVIKERVEALESELEGLVGGGGSVAMATIKARGYTISAAGRARIAAAQRARWAKAKGNKAKRKMSAAGRAAISRAAKARWAKARAAGRKTL